ncbi:hypothetical protein Ancab_038946 [Ancistrocladus abbreviatus]
MVVGAGGVRPCNSAFGANQFNPNIESGKRGFSGYRSLEKRHMKLAEQPWVSLFDYVTHEAHEAHTNQFRFLNKAAVIAPDDQINPDGPVADLWNLCTIQ